MFSSNTTPGGEKGEVPEVHLFLDDVLRTPVLDRDRGFLLLLLLRRLLLLLLLALPHDESERRLQRRRIGHVSLDALLDGVLRLSE
jgi:hypothetical protein